MLEDGRVVSVDPPNRHPSIIMLCQSRGWRLSGSTQGFILENGEFVDRSEGLKIAKRENQILPGRGKEHQLYTEDLW